MGKCKKWSSFGVRSIGEVYQTTFVDVVEGLRRGFERHKEQARTWRPWDHGKKASFHAPINPLVTVALVIFLQ